MAQDAVLREAVERAAAGDEAAWAQLVGDLTGMLRWVAQRHGLAESDLADVVQDTWLTCLVHIGTLRDPQALPAWLITTCRRQCLRLLREQARCVPQDSTDVLSSIAALTDPDADPCDRAAARDRAARLYAEIDALPTRQRDVMRGLLARGSEDYVGAARTLGIPLGSLGPTRRRAIARLQTRRALHVVG